MDIGGRPILDKAMRGGAFQLWGNRSGVGTQSVSSSKDAYGASWVREHASTSSACSGCPQTETHPMRSLRLLQKHGVEYNILTTVNRVNNNHLLEVHRFLRDEARTDWMQFPWANSQDVKNAVCGKWCELAHLNTYPTRRLLP